MLSITRLSCRRPEPVSTPAARPRRPLLFTGFGRLLHALVVISLIVICPTLARAACSCNAYQQPISLKRPVGGAPPTVDPSSFPTPLFNISVSLDPGGPVNDCEAARHALCTMQAHRCMSAGCADSAACSASAACAGIGVWCNWMNVTCTAAQSTAASGVFSMRVHMRSSAEAVAFMRSLAQTMSVSTVLVARVAILVAAAICWSKSRSPGWLRSAMAVAVIIAFWLSG